MNGILWMATAICNNHKLMEAHARMQAAVRVWKDRNNDAVDAAEWQQFCATERQK